MGVDGGRVNGGGLGGIVGDWGSNRDPEVFQDTACSLNRSHSFTFNDQRGVSELSRYQKVAPRSIEYSKVYRNVKDVTLYFRAGN